MGGYEVTNSCRGCLARRCEDVCPKGCLLYTSEMEPPKDDGPYPPEEHLHKEVSPSGALFVITVLTLLPIDVYKRQGRCCAGFALSLGAFAG